MVEEWRQSRKLVISFVGIVCGGCWKTPYPSANRFGAMSRCYPYPPPGYQKKAQAELILSPKKENHKHKDKKKKKRTDCDANGVSHGGFNKRRGLLNLPVLTDKDKRSKKVQRTELVNEVVTVENRKIQEIKAVCPTFKMGNPLQRTLSKGAGNSRSEQLPESASCDKALNDKAREANGRADGQLSLIVDRHAGNGNASVAGDLSPPISHALGNGIDLSRQRHAHSMPQTLEVWSAVDDQEWLFLHNNQLRLKPREKTGESGTSHVLAEALFLPSVDIYALPYVVPY